MKYKNIQSETHPSWSILIGGFVSILPILAILFNHDNPTMGIIFNILFIMLIFYIIYKQDKEFESTYKWEKTDAQVKRKRILKYNCITIYMKNNISNKSYKLDITYQYEFNGEIFISNQYAMAYKGDADCNFLYTLDEAKKIMHKITRDKKITIYVNPSNLNESVIVQGKSDRYGVSYFILFLYIASLIYLLFKVYYV